MALTKFEKIQKKAAAAASRARIEEGHRVAQKAVAENQCPMCGAHVHANLSIIGWVQCDRLGAEGFRKDPTGPSCSWQGFTH